MFLMSMSMRVLLVIPVLLVRILLVIVIPVLLVRVLVVVVVLIVRKTKTVGICVSWVQHEVRVCHVPMIAIPIRRRLVAFEENGRIASKVPRNRVIK